MIDTRRWILVETWLSLGLKIEWARPFFQRGDSDDAGWQNDEDGRPFRYAGDKTWELRRPGAGYEQPREAPQLHVETMRHELAHYLSATPKERKLRNFGMPADDPSPPQEERAGAAEDVIEAVMMAATRIADLAIMGRRE